MNDETTGETVYGCILAIMWIGGFICFLSNAASNPERSEWAILVSTLGFILILGHTLDRI